SGSYSVFLGAGVVLRFAGRVDDELRREALRGASSWAEDPGDASVGGTGRSATIGSSGVGSTGGATISVTGGVGVLGVTTPGVAGGSTAGTTAAGSAEPPRSHAGCRIAMPAPAETTTASRPNPTPAAMPPRRRRRGSSRSTVVRVPWAYDGLASVRARRSLGV